MANYTLTETRPDESILAADRAYRGGHAQPEAMRCCAVLCFLPPSTAEGLGLALRQLAIGSRPIAAPEELRDLLFDENVALAIVHFGHDVPQGEAACRTIRKHRDGGELPILAIINEATAQSFPLDCGADDVLVEGLSGDEAALRVRLALWRKDVPFGDGTTRIGDLLVDTVAMRVRLSGVPVHLTYKEFHLLRHFVQNPGIALKREGILDAVWGDDYFGGDRTVDIHVRRLRSKLPPLTRHIETVHGVGYRFVLPRPDQ